jgi:hypothetical protein
MRDSSEPRHIEAGIAVVFHGALESDADGYLLVRRYTDAATMEDQLARFYATPGWREGPRQTLVDAIEDSHRLIVNSFPQSLQLPTNGA